MQTLKRIPYLGTVALLVYMPFHIFLTQSLSLLTGGLDAWKVAKDVATALLLILILFLVFSQGKTNKLFGWFFGLATAYGLIHLLVWVINPDIYRQTAILGSVYNNRLIWYLLIGMGSAILCPVQMNQRRIIRIVLLVSSLVCLLGILQYFLPKDILTHLGYSLERGVKPAFFIDDKTDLPRIMSTLRDPNSLGAYLILPITLLVYKLFHVRKSRQTLLIGLLGLHGLALLLTFSRSAWVGTAISLAFFGAYHARKHLTALAKKYWPILVGAVLLIGGLTLVFRNQYAVQNILVHSDKNTTAQYDSNEYHYEYAKRGLSGIWHNPLGNGPGTAGIVSIQNPHGGLLTENYFIQIGYEVGLLGLLVFVIVNILIYKLLSRSTTPLAICLLASFWGYVLVNMLLHSWSNEAVASQWWLLAGLAIGTPLVNDRAKKVIAKKPTTIRRKLPATS